MTKSSAKFVKLRDKLKEEYTLSSFKAIKKQISADGSIKYLYTMHDNKSIEAVFMPWYDDSEKKEY